MKHVRIYPSGIFICLLFLLLTPNLFAQARSFDVTTPKNIVITKPVVGHDYVHIFLKRLQPGNITIQVTVENPHPKLTVYPLNGSLSFPDSVNTTGFGIQYSSSGMQKIDTRIFLFDGVATRDTITVHAEDTRLLDTLAPFAVVNTPYLVTSLSPTKFRLEMYIKDPKGPTVSAKITSVNYSSQALPMKAVLVDPKNTFLLSPTQYMMPIPDTGITSGQMNITYTISGRAFDTAYVYLWNEELHKLTDTIIVTTRDSLLQYKPYLASDTVYFLKQTMGQKVCKDLVFKNPFSHTTTITDIRSTATGNITLDPVSLPITVQPDGSVTLRVCYDAPTTPSDISVLSLDLDLLHSGGLTNTVHAFAKGTTLECYTFSPAKKLAIRATLAGGRSNSEFTIKNNLPQTVTIESFTKRSTNTHEDAFSIINTTFPIILTPGATTIVGVRFLPGESIPALTNCSVDYDILFSGATDSICLQSLCSISSTILAPRDSFTVNMFANGTGYIPLYSTKNKATYEIKVYIGGSGYVRVLSIAPKDGTHFRVLNTDPTPLPFVIRRGYYFTLWLEFDAGLGGIYEDSLEIVTEDALQAYVVPIQGVRSATLDIKENTAENVNISISPNPASSEVHITLQSATAKEIVIYDILGNVVSRKGYTNNWTWNVDSPAGTYFIHVEGINSNGMPFVKTERVIVK